MARLKFVPKRKSYSYDTFKTIPSPTPAPSLPHYSSVNPNPDNYPLNSTLDLDGIDSLVKINSKTNYSFRPPSF